jgi:hypothetical protein
MGFPISPKIFSLGRAVTPGEYARLLPAIEKNWEREKAGVLERGPALGTNFTDITAARLRLGSLGRAVVVSFSQSPECGATGNCPMAVYVRTSSGYRRVISSGGWGYALLPSAGPVPTVAFYSNLSAGESVAAQFHYAGKKFVQGSPTDCTERANSKPVCAAMDAALLNTRSMAISPAEYAALRPEIEASIRKLPAKLQREFSYVDSHGVQIGGLLNESGNYTFTALAVGPCRADENCRIFIYARRYPGARYLPLLTGAIGWGTTRIGFESPDNQRLAVAIVRRVSASQEELTRYSVSTAAMGSSGEMVRDSRLLPEACEIVTPKTGGWPVRWVPAALVARPVSCFGNPSRGRSSLPVTDITDVTKVVQDGSGTVWGLSSGSFAKLYRWRNGGWSSVPTPTSVADSVPKSERRSNVNERIPLPTGLWKGPDGGVLTIWLTSSATEGSELVWLRGNQAKILASLPGYKETEVAGPMDVTNVAFAAKGIVLITGDGGDRYQHGILVSGPAPGIFRVSADGKVQRIFTFLRDQYLRYRIYSRWPPDFFLPLHSTRDAQGKVWIWCGWGWPPGPPGAAFAGFLVTDGKTVTYHRRILRMPFLHLTTLGVWDKNHLVAGTFGNGLFTINTTTFEARHVSEPEPGAFFFVRKVFSAGSDLYVLTLGPNPRIRLRPEFSALLTDALWRFHDGQWKEIVSNVGNTDGEGLATPRGFWLAKSESGLMFVPLKRPPKEVGWRQGMPSGRVARIFRLPDGNLVAYGGVTGRRTTEFHPTSVLRRKAPRLRVSVLHPLTKIESGLHHNLWGLLPDRVLGEWDGSRWINHPLPQGIMVPRISGLDVDTRGRIWLFPDCFLGPMGFYNPTVDRWSVFSSYRTALVQRHHRVVFLHPADDRTRPIYGPNSQIVFVGICWGVNYFTGSGWRLFQGRGVPPDRNIAIPPFFDSSGHLALDIRNTTWQWTPQTGWQPTAGKPPAAYIPQLPNPLAPPLSPPVGCESPPPSSLVKDSLGRSWWVAGDALYEGVPGHCRKILSASVPQPFTDGRKLVAAKIDLRGNAFLETAGPSSYVVVPRKLYGGEPPRVASTRAGGR